MFTRAHTGRWTSFDLLPNASRALVVALACAPSCASDDAAQKSPPASAPVTASTEGAARDDARELIELSGMGMKLHAAARVAEFFVGNLRETAMRVGADDDDVERMLDRMTTLALHSAGPAYKSDRLRAHIEDRMSRAPASVLAFALAHYRDPRADRTALVHAELSTPAGQHRLSRFLADVRNGEIDPTKVLVIEGMLGASREVDLTVALAFDTSSSFLHSLEPALPPPIREPRERLLARRIAFEASAKRQLTMQLAYVYTQLDDTDLQAEARFWASADGRAFADLRVDAVAHALTVAEREATESVMHALQTMEREAPPPPPTGETPIDA